MDLQKFESILSTMMSWLKPEIETLNSVFPSADLIFTELLRFIYERVVRGNVILPASERNADWIL